MAAKNVKDLWGVLIPDGLRISLIRRARCLVLIVAVAALFGVVAWLRRHVVKDVVTAVTGIFSMIVVIAAACSALFVAIQAMQILG